MPMKLTHKDFDDLRLITVEEDRIDAASAIKFKDGIRNLTQGAPDRVLLDLAQVEFLDSSGLGAIVACMKALGNGMTLELAALQPPVERVFHLTRMNTVFKIHTRVSDATTDTEHAS